MYFRQIGEKTIKEGKNKVNTATSASSALVAYETRKTAGMVKAAKKTAEKKTKTVKAVSQNVLGARVSSRLGLKGKESVVKAEQAAKAGVKAGMKAGVKAGIRQVTPQVMIKRFVKMAKLKKMVNGEPSDYVKNVGKTGINLVISLSVSAFKLVVKLAGTVLRLLATFLGPYFILLTGLLVIIIAMLFSDDNIMRNRMAQTERETTASQLESPRLTADGILENEWYVGNINPFTASGYGLVRYVNGVTYYGNCTAYAWGRWAEILGYAPALPTGNAGTWYDSNAASGIYDYGQVPRPGAIACWAYRTGGAGHVAVVEVIEEDGTIIMSESQYNGGTRRDIRNLFYTRTFASAEMVEQLWLFKGYIYLPDVLSGE